jgi:FHA domain-containing protein
MILTLKAVSLNDQPLSPSIVARFDAGGGTIGRADHNTLALPDPERHISRLQAEIVLRGDAFMVRNVGAANPVLVGTRALMQGDDCDLAQGDVLRIGGYALLVDYRNLNDPAEITRGQVAGPRTGTGTGTGADAAWPAGPPSVVGPGRGATTAPGVAAAAQANPFADLLGVGGSGVGGSNPFADLLGSAAPQPPALPPAPPPPPAWGAPQPRSPAPAAADPFADLLPGPAGVQPASAALAQPSQPRPASRLPADFDPFASPPSAPPPPARSRSTAPALDDLGVVGRPQSIDQAFGLEHGSDPLARFMADAAAPAPAPGACARSARCCAPRSTARAS